MGKKKTDTKNDGKGFINHIGNRIFGFLFPVYDELVLFLYSLIALLYIAMNIKSLFESLMLDFKNGRVDDIICVCLAIIIIMYIILLPVYHAFSKRKKKGYEKFILILVISLANWIVAWETYDFLKAKDSNAYLIIPLINAIQASIFFLFVFNKKTKYENIIEHISDENVNILEVIISGTLIILLFLLYNYKYQSFWAITVSTCIFYATSINRIIITMIRNILSYTKR